MLSLALAVVALVLACVAGGLAAYAFWLLRDFD
jgi:ABC-type spermidine/putrescine transport system permease subunit II